MNRRHSLNFSVTVTLALLLNGCSDTSEPPSAGARDTAPKTVTATTEDPGAALYARHCGSCHDSGDGHPGTMRLAARGGPGSAVLLERDDLPPALIRDVVRAGAQMMPPFRPSEISDADLEPLARYVARNYREPEQ